MAFNFYKTIDKIIGGTLITLIKILHRKKPSPKSTGKILIIKLWAIGDSINFLPAIDALRKNYPNSQIDVLVRKRNKDVFECYDKINCIFLFEREQILKIIKKFKHYDLVIDGEPYLNISALLGWYLGKFQIGLANQYRSNLYDLSTPFDRNKHFVQKYLDMVRLLGIKYDTDKLVPLEVKENDKKIVDGFLKNISGDFVGVCVGAAESAKTRMWSKEKFAELASILVSKHNLNIIFTGAPNEAEYINEIIEIIKKINGNNKNEIGKNKIGTNRIISTAGKLSLKQTFDLISRCKLYISNDTGPMHIAAAQGVKTIGLFGPNTPSLWKPYGKGNVAIYHKLECSPCIRNEKGYMPDCLRKTDRYECMKLITVPEVLKEAEKFLGKEKIHVGTIHIVTSDQNDTNN